jgi:hypothetical protein
MFVNACDTTARKLAGHAVYLRSSGCDRDTYALQQLGVLMLSRHCCSLQEVPTHTFCCSQYKLSRFSFACSLHREAAWQPPCSSWLC